MWGEDTAHISVAASVAQSTFNTQHVKRSGLAARSKCRRRRRPQYRNSPAQRVRVQLDVQLDVQRRRPQYRNSPAQVQLEVLLDVREKDF